MIFLPRKIYFSDLTHIVMYVVKRIFKNIRTAFIRLKKVEDKINEDATLRVYGTILMLKTVLFVQGIILSMMMCVHIQEIIKLYLSTNSRAVKEKTLIAPPILQQMLWRGNEGPN